MSNKPEKPLNEHTYDWFRRMVMARRNSLWQPATDAYEAEDRFIVVIEMAGMQAGNFTVTLANRQLIIEGRRTPPIDERVTAYHQLEVRYGDFRTAINLPWVVDRESISATYEDGFLKVVLPRQKQENEITVVNISSDNEKSGDTHDIG